MFKISSGDRQKIVYNDDTKWDVIEQTTVYYWLNKYFDFLAERFNHKSNTFLKVYTNRSLENENGEGTKMNNAFFNPMDTTLSFLPAQKNLMFRLLAGKLNRSGFDPSVIAHEASHFFFSQLYPNAVNNEIAGLNEGFADYIANIFLNNPKIGLVMMHGKTLRDSSNELDKNKNAKVYGVSMESHDLGERVSLALWKTRELATNPEEFDNLIIDAIKELAQTPYGTIHDFKQKMVDRLNQAVASDNLEKAQQIWENIFPGNPRKIKNLNFLEKVQKDLTYYRFKIKNKVRESLANEMGLEKEKEQIFTELDQESISEFQKAILIATEKNNVVTPYWFVIDTKRNNTMGIFNMSGELVKSKEQIDELSNISKELIISIDDIFSIGTKMGQFADLSSGTGQLASFYKVDKKVISDRAVTFSGQTYAGKEIKMNIKKRLIARLIPNLPEINKITLITAKLSQSELESLPTLDDVAILGYKLELQGKNSIEIMIEEMGNL